MIIITRPIKGNVSLALVNSSNFTIIPRDITVLEHLFLIILYSVCIIILIIYSVNKWQ